MTESARTWYILRIALVAAGLIILFFSGIFPVENYLALVSPSQLSAAVVASDVATLTNDNRTENGLPELTVNPLLTQAAQLKANDMAQNSYYAHISPDGKSPLYWLNRVGYKYLNAGENLVIDRTTSEEVVSAWMNSPDHRENILRPQFTQVGIGVAAGQYDGIDTIFVVQEFGTPYPLSASTPHTANAAPQQANVQLKASVSAPSQTQAAVPATNSLITEVKKFITPVVHSIAPLTVSKPVVITGIQVAPTSTPSATSSTKNSHTKPAPKASTTTTSSTESATLSADETPSFSYALAPGFFAPVQFTQVHEQTATLVTPSVPKMEDPTPTWLVQFRAYVQRFTNFVPRVW